MPASSFNRQNVARLIQQFKLTKLFIEELGWNRTASPLPDLVTVAQQDYSLARIAEKAGVVLFQLNALPDYKTRRQIEREVTRLVREHLIVFCDPAQTIQIWHWVRREPGKTDATREYQYRRGQSEQALTAKLEALLVPLDKEGDLTVADMSDKTRQGFDVERVTKNFFREFQKQHDLFLQFIQGITSLQDREWYASLMLNRLMFVSFIQDKGFLDGQGDYLRQKLRQSQAKNGPDKFFGFYRHFLLRLFHEGLGSRPRTSELDALLGQIPYLNGGLFELHQLERDYPALNIPDEAFEQVFAFLAEWRWKLDERPGQFGNEINPDVLGYIFEKYINQKQMGAYYTKEDITDYISKNTIIPFLFEATQASYPPAFLPNSPLWQLLMDEPDRYIYEAVRRGVDQALPNNIAVGVKNVGRREDWNRSAPADFALPTEIWREVVARRQRYQDIVGRLGGGEVFSINALITFNLDIRRFAQDALEFSDDPAFLLAFYQSLTKVTVLDPTCGSGAFLFAALNILQPLYEACLERMERFLAEGEAGQAGEFGQILKTVNQHLNRRYFVFKAIIVNNLYGVDIMEEAVEIARLRLFLKLAAQVEPDPTKANLGLEPLPDIDFNIQAGNTLVGFATLKEAFQAVDDSRIILLNFEQTKEEIEQGAKAVNQGFTDFQALQLLAGGEQADLAPALQAGKQQLRGELAALGNKLNRFLAARYNIDQSNIPDKAKYEAAFAAWRKSHQPFHWCIEFYRILQNGGFDVIIGNPPYVEYSKVKREYTIKSYQTESSGNLYALITERSLNIQKVNGSFGFIVPISLVCTQRMGALQKIINSKSQAAWFSNYAERPSKLFTGAEVLTTIVITRINSVQKLGVFSTGFTKWASSERDSLFERITYSQIEGKPKPYIIPKTSAAIEVQILRKMVTQGSLLTKNLKRKSDYPIYYRIGGGRYWKIFTSFQPRFVLNAKVSVSSRENYLYFANAVLRDVTITLLSSSLFYWYFILTTNCRDLNPSDLQEFPINLDGFLESHVDKLSNLCKNLMDDYKNKSQLKEKSSSLTGIIVYQEFYPRLSKPIIDEIDRVLAQHYGFSDEELDFIINYDIKYRMGRQADDDDPE